MFLNEVGKNREAELELKAIVINPQYANAYYNLAVIFIGQGKFKKQN